MLDIKIHILSVYLKKWSFGENRFTINYAFTANDLYRRRHKEFHMTKSEQLLDEFFEQIKTDSLNALHEKGSENYNLQIMQFEIVRPLLKNYFENIVKEFKGKKNASGKMRMNLSRSMDLYYKENAYSLLDDRIKFYVHLNRGLNKVNGELWSQALTDLLRAYKFNPMDIVVNKYLAISYNKLGKFSRAISPLQVYAKAENTPESLNALAEAYINLEDYEKADAIYKEITAKFGDAHLARYGRAYIAYKQGKEFTEFLDEIMKEDPAWLTEKLKNDWDYSLENLKNHTEWNAATAARYLGYNRPFDLTRKAINKEIPCYYDADKGTVRFIREELDCWVELHNRYNLDGKKYDVFVDRLLPQENKEQQKAPLSKK